MPKEPYNPDNNLITILGLESLPDEEKAKIVEQVTVLVQKRVVLRIMELLSDEDAKRAETLADKPEEMLEFLASKVPDMSGLIVEETEKVKRELALESLSDVPPKSSAGQPQGS